MMKFHKIYRFWVTDFKAPDISFGIHICMDGRLDIHLIYWMFSFGNVPIYKHNNMLIAVSNSYHSAHPRRKEDEALRAGVPHFKHGKKYKERN